MSASSARCSAVLPALFCRLTLAFLMMFVKAGQWGAGLASARGVRSLDAMLGVPGEQKGDDIGTSFPRGKHESGMSRAVL
jgi:hypothetical protein